MTGPVVRYHPLAPSGVIDMRLSRALLVLVIPVADHNFKVTSIVPRMVTLLQITFLSFLS
jgi:hypothetical protein